MFQYKCLNPISQTGLGLFGEEYKQTEDLNNADAVLVRSAKMHDMELPENVKVIARAGAGVNNIPVDACAEKGIVVFNTPGANANGVKELVLAGMLLASRDIVGGIEWVAHEEDKEHIDKLAEKQKPSPALGLHGNQVFQSKADGTCAEIFRGSRIHDSLGLSSDRKRGRRKNADTAVFHGSEIRLCNQSRPQRA